MSIQEVRVQTKPELADIKGRYLLSEIQNTLHITGITGVTTAKVYRLEGVTAKQAEFLAERLLAEEVFQVYTVNAPLIKNAHKLIEVFYKPGVMNPESGSILKAAADLGISDLAAADSGYEYGFYGALSEAEIELILSRLLVNDTVEMVVRQKPDTLIIEGKSGGTLVIPVIDMDEEALMELSRDNLFLNLAEMLSIQNYFIGLGRNPTDCEIETLAQTWSEHCGHKTFKSDIIIDGQVKKPFIQRLKDSTDQVAHPLVLSAFEDDSGVMHFYDDLALCGKVETHNSPSAIEPYGGAMTGSGGVFRDIMGTGTGAQVITSTDIFCFAPPDLPLAETPPGCLHPQYLLRRVVEGVRDYGNRMGVPTNNGSVHFHRDFMAKPSVIVGAYGVIPTAAAGKRTPYPGDLAVVLGGRTGRDGIHGATFSSGEMTHRTIDVNSSAVQIGHAIEEKRMSDALLRARDEGLIRAITDCGAGGFASSFGEMGEDTGVRIYLDRAPLKYEGLAPWEIWISESQERMALAVEPKHLTRLKEICLEHNVEASVIGEFTDSHKLELFYNEEPVGELTMEFLHHGLPKRELVAVYQERKTQLCEPEPPRYWEQVCAEVLRHLNVCSKEPIVRMYDHGVQGSNVLPPFGGVTGSAPNDAVVVTPLLGKPYGAVIAHGLNPVLNKEDPYAGSIWAAAEAVSNAVAVGANPDELVLVDNFIWPFPDEESLYDLDRAVDACVDFVQATGMPFISGKDSLSSTYRYPDGTVLKIPPVLCVSCFGRIYDVNKTISADFKRTDSLVAFVGKRDIEQMGGSAYFDVAGGTSPKIPQIDPDHLLTTWRSLYQAVQEGLILSCHDISEGGLLTTLAEMCWGGGVGVQIRLSEAERADYSLFNETAGCFVIEFIKEDEKKIQALLGDADYRIIGNTVLAQNISAAQGDRPLFNVSLADLANAWQKPMQEVFGG